MEPLMTYCDKCGTVFSALPSQGAKPKKKPMQAMTFVVDGQTIETTAPSEKKGLSNVLSVYGCNKVGLNPSLARWKYNNGQIKVRRIK